MDTQKIMQAISGGIAGFFVLLCAEGALFGAFLASFDPISLGATHKSTLSWSLLIVAVLLFIIASALPVIALGASKKFGLFAGLIASASAIIIISLTSQDSRGAFDMTETLAFMALIGIPILVLSYRLSNLHSRGFGALLATLVILLILEVATASIARIAGLIASFTAWVILPAAAAILHSRQT
jgi:hypothetical protein